MSPLCTMIEIGSNNVASIVGYSTVGVHHHYLQGYNGKPTLAGQKINNQTLTHNLTSRLLCSHKKNFLSENI